MSILVLIALFAQPLVVGPDSVELEIETLVDGELVLQTRFFQVDSIMVTVPEIRTDSASRTIELPVVRIRATGDHAEEPIFWLGGGPGQTSLRTFDYDYFIDRHDHVMVGYRGVDGSVDLDCPEVTRVLEQVDDVLAVEALEQVGDAFVACAQRLGDEGVSLDGYTIPEVVHDIEHARKALGYDRIHLVAESFGTRLAYLYALLYPENVHRMVLVGAQPPGGMIWDPAQSDGIVEHYGELWAEDPDLLARHSDLADAVRTVNQDMPGSWLFMPIYPGNVKASAFPMLFHRESAARVFDTYVAAANGDPSGLWLISIVAPFIFPEVVNWGENASKAVSADYEPGRDYFRELMPDDAIIGAPLGAFLWSPASLWPIQRIEEQYRTARETQVQTLLLGGSVDFSTPAENVTNGLIPFMPNATHVVLSEMGHIMDLWRTRPESTYRMLTSFIETGTVDTSTVEHVPMDFSVRWGFPLLAKMVVGGTLLLLVLVALGVWAIFRFVRRRRNAR